MALLRRARAHALRRHAEPHIRPDHHQTSRQTRSTRETRSTAVLVSVALVAGLLGAVATSTVAPPPARAATCKTWVATGSSARFHDAANWSPAGVPTATDCVLAGSTQTDVLVDADATVASWEIGGGIKDLIVTAGATFRLASTTDGSRLNGVTGESGRFLTDNPTTEINDLLVVAGKTFTLAGPGATTVKEGFVAGTLKVGKTDATGGAPRDANVSLSLATLLPGSVLVDGPVSTTLRLVDGTPNTGLGNGFSATSAISAGTKGTTVVDATARLQVKNGQRLTTAGTFTVERRISGGVDAQAAIVVDEGGRLTFGNGLTNYNATDDALERGRWSVRGRIDLPGPLAVNRAEVSYLGGDFFAANAVTRPTANERLLEVGVDLSLTNLSNRIGPLGQTPQVIVNGTVGAGLFQPATLTVGGAGLQSEPGGVIDVRAHSALDCTVTCSTRDTDNILNGEVIGTYQIDDLPASAQRGRLRTGAVSSALDPSHIDSLVLSDDSVTDVDLSSFSPAFPPGYFETTSATVGGQLRINPGSRSFAVGDQIAILRSTSPIVGGFADIAITSTVNGLIFDLVTTPTTITAVVKAKPVASFTQATSTVTEGSGATTHHPVQIHLNDRLGYPAQLVVGTTAGTANRPGDFDLPQFATPVFVPAGQTDFTVDVAVVADSTDELDEIGSLVIGSSSLLTFDPATNDHAVTIVDDDGTAPVLSIANVSKTEGSLTNSTANVTLTRSGSTVSPSTVAVTSSNGTATAGSDYTAVSTTVTFAAGETTKTVPVTVLADVAPEADETVKLTLSNPTNGTIGTAVGTLTITNDDGALPTVSLSDVTVVEGTGGSKTATVTITRSGNTIGSSTVAVSTTDGTATAPADYTTTSTILTFSPAQTTKTFTVPIATDATPEAVELVGLSITNAFSASIGQATGAVRIQDDDPAVSFAVANVGKGEGDTGASNLGLVLTRSTTLGPATPSVQVATANGTATAPGDYTAVSQTVTFAAGNPTATVAIPIKGDQTAEADETFTATLSNPSTGASIGSPGTATVTITNDDGPIPALTVADQELVEPGSSSAVRSLRVTRTGGTDGAVAFRATFAAGTASSPADVVAGFADATIPVGASFVDVPVTLGGDTTSEDVETFTVTLSNVVGATVADGTGVVTIRDDDPRITVESTTLSTPEGDAGLKTVTVTLRRSTTFGPATPSVTLSTANGTASAGSDYVGVAGTTVTFAAGSPTATVNLGITGDTAVESDETFTATISAPSAGAKIGTPSTATITITNDDGPRFHALNPGRLLDSRDGTGTTATKWQAGQTRSVQITGQQGVPATGVRAVVLNVTVTGSTAGSHLRLFPTGTALPNASSINFDQGQTIANMAVVKLGTGGKIDVFNNSGQTDVIADVVGYYDDGGTGGDRYNALSPGRLLDSRDGTGATATKWQAGQTRSVQITGQQGVPATGVRAVVLNVTVTGSTAGSHLRLFPTGTALPNASSINFDQGQTIANGAVVKLGTGGKIDVFNNSGQTDVIADVVGYYSATGDVYTPLNPGRLLDSRDGTGATATKWQAGQTRSVQITGQQGVPATGVRAVVLNVTVTGSTAGSHLRLFPTGTALPNASSINFDQGQTIANLVVVKVGAGGKIDVFNNSGQTDVIADVVGWFG